MNYKKYLNEKSFDIGLRALAVLAVILYIAFVVLIFVALN